MSADAATISVVSILGRDYSIKAPAHQQPALREAALMLKAALAETKQSYPGLIGDKLLVLAALNLCSQQIELKAQHALELARVQEQVSATVDVISRTLGQTA